MTLLARRLFLSAPILILTSLTFSCGSGEAETRPDIILITIDTLRADHLGCYGYDPYPLPVSPNIDALAGQSVTFEGCFVPRGQTLPSLTSLHTGLYPATHRVRENGLPLRRDIQTLAQSLQDAGYQNAAFLANLPAPMDLRTQSPFQRTLLRGFDEVWVPQTARRAPPFQDQNDEEALSRAIGLVESSGPRSSRDKPLFLWLHLYDVHKPFDPRERFQTPFLRDGDAKADDERDSLLIAQATLRGRPLDDEAHRRILALYDGGIASADERVGRLLDALKRKWSFDPSWIVLSSDHGEELGDHHAYYYHGASIYDSVLRVPLLIKTPGSQSPSTFGGDIRSFDVMPTLLEAANVPLPENLEGHSLMPVLEGKPEAISEEPVFAEWQELVTAIRTSEWKYIYNPRGVHPKKPPYTAPRSKRGFPLKCEELYARDDAQETRNLVSNSGDVAAALRQKIADFLDEESHRAPMEFLDENDPTRQELEALGYVGSLRDRLDVIFDAEDCSKKR